MKTQKSKKEMLELRKKLKAKKPVFVRDDSYKVKRVDASWRRPKGLHAKLRIKYKQAGRFVSPGFGSPALVHGLDRSGYEPVLVSNASMVDMLNAKEQAALIASTVGTRKRIEILNRAKEKNVVVLNVKNAEEFINAAKKVIADRKESSKQKEDARKAKQEAAKKAEKKESKDSIDKKVDAAKADADAKAADKTTDKKEEGHDHTHHDHKHDHGTNKK